MFVLLFVLVESVCWISRSPPTRIVVEEQSLYSVVSRRTHEEAFVTQKNPDVPTRSQKAPHRKIPTSTTTTSSSSLSLYYSMASVRTKSHTIKTVKIIKNKMAIPMPCGQSNKEGGCAVTTTLVLFLPSLLASALVSGRRRAFCSL